MLIPEHRFYESQSDAKAYHSYLFILSTLILFDEKNIKVTAYTQWGDRHSLSKNSHKKRGRNPFLD
ncbi:MAG: hypothetical protein WBB82_08295 [Limnothrix sp.]